MGRVSRLGFHSRVRLRCQPRGGWTPTSWQHLNDSLASADSVQIAPWVRLAVIPSADEALCFLAAFFFIVLHLFSAEGGGDVAAVADLLRINERLEGIYTKVKGENKPPHLATTMFYDMPRM